MSFEAAGLGAGLALLAFFAFIALLVLGTTAFWIWMIVDCAQAPETPGSNERVVWILVLVFTGWLGALIYYFAARRPRLRAARRYSNHLPRSTIPPPAPPRAFG